MSKAKTYIIYWLSLISAYMVYWLFSLLSSYSFISFLSFVASVLHFGISSWLFFFLNKSGRVLSITTGFIMIIWPVQIVIHSLIDKEYSLLPYYMLPVVFSLVTSIMHVLHIGKPSNTGRIARVVMSTLATLLFLIYVLFVTVESVKEGALNIVF